MSQNSPTSSHPLHLDLRGHPDVKHGLARIDQLTNLQILRLDNCKNLTELPEQVCELLFLKELSMQNCENLKELHSSFGQLNNMERLNLSGCSSLNELPSSFQQLQSLKFLDLSHCNVFKGLPSSFGSLGSLLNLDLSFCDSLLNLPETFGNLSSLETLNLEFCQNLLILPSNFGNLCSLETLKLSGCEDLERLPNDLGNLKSLRRMEFQQDRSLCSGMETLPESFGELSCLEELTLRCPNLESLPQSFGRLRNLRDLDLSGCEVLCSLPENFGHLESLKFLNIQFCCGLQRVWDDSETLISLKAVNAADCHLEGDALDKFLEVKDLILLYIAGSQLLRERWEQVKEQKITWVICDRPAAEVDSFDWDTFESVAGETKSTTFFHPNCKFVDSEGNVADDSFPAVNLKLALLFAMPDVSSSSLKVLKRKCAELVSQNFQLVYVAVGEQSEEDIKRMLVGVLPQGTTATAWAWAADDQRRRDLMGFSALLGEIRRNGKVERLCAFISIADISVDKMGKKCLGDLEPVFPEKDDNDFTALLDSEGGFQRMCDPVLEVIHRMAEA